MENKGLQLGGPDKAPEKVELYKIDTGIPIPSKESKYSVLDRLKIGESVLFNVPRSASLSPAIHRIQQKSGKRFTRAAREGGVRVWRVDPAAKLTTEPPITPKPRKRRPRAQAEGMQVAVGVPGVVEGD